MLLAIWCICTLTVLMGFGPEPGIGPVTVRTPVIILLPFTPQGLRSVVTFIYFLIVTCTLLAFSAVVSINIKIKCATHLSCINIAFNEPQKCFRPLAGKHRPRASRVTNLGGILGTSNAVVRLFFYFRIITGCGGYVRSNDDTVVFFVYSPRQLHSQPRLLY